MQKESLRRGPALRLCKHPATFISTHLLYIVLIYPVLVSVLAVRVYNNGYPFLLAEMYAYSMAAAHENLPHLQTEHHMVSAGARLEVVNHSFNISKHGFPLALAAS